ncbi:acetolactate decarboxylase [Candidatus Synechococcus calcipolaris G9]|uniref:Alpha-acetolactate decarboxylase n=1 Tax=Candidatus Synechococcus calcipolaris G9 TaxID=1497997 RepID=A0ABT6EVQ0_9SYNE|nr:acetolactate decarboxylase [Candidatus Synechococcus calcipolaris]MDG2989881.1 acetolactate decarboxylase [Candidatus Synechococcus calcipolaris G9]
MKLKRWLWWPILLLLTTFAINGLSTHGWPAYSQNAPSTLGFQVSTLGALNIGIYEGATTMAELKEHGDFGLGTFEGLDGEMVILDGTVYKIDVDGGVHRVEDDTETPFSVVSFFHRQRSLPLGGNLSYQELEQRIDESLPSLNWPYALRIHGTFPYLKFRSVPKQTPPYPPLLDVVRNEQRIFEERNVTGTLVGFRLPPYLSNINVPGYHFHFITSDRRTGGHILDGEFINPTVELDTLDNWQIMLPDNAAFKQALLE